MATLRPVSRGTVAAQAAGPVKPVQPIVPRVPLPAAAQAAVSAVKVNGKPTQLVGKQSGSLSNSADPHGPLLHPTDLAIFKRKGKR